MRALLQIPVTKIEPPIDTAVFQVPSPSEGLMVVVPIIISAVVYCIKEMVKTRSAEKKAQVEITVAEEQAEIKERATLIDDFRSQNRLLMQALLAKLGQSSSPGNTEVTNK